MLSFHTTIAAYGPAAAIFLTEEQAAQLSDAKTPPVLVRSGGRTARLRITRMGGPICIGLSKAARAELGVEIGDAVDVEVELDQAERVVEPPADLASELAAHARAQQAWDGLSYTRRKEIARSIDEAKRPETRARRLAAALAELLGTA